MRKNKTITQVDRLALIGLLTLGRKLNKQLDEIEKAMLEITGEQVGDSSSHCATSLHNVASIINTESHVDKLLRLLNITISDNLQKNDSLLDNGEWIRVSEMKTILNVRETKVRQLIKAKAFPVSKPHGIIYARRSDVEEYINRRLDN